MKDHNFAVREQVFKSLSNSKEFLGGEKYNEIMQRYVLQLAGEANYIYRVTAATCLQNVKNL